MTVTFDIRNEVAEIPAKGLTEVPFVINIGLAQEVKALRGQADVDEDVLLAKEKELDAATYVAYVTSLPRRQREDIYTRALTEFVPKPSLLNARDEKAEYLRGNFVQVQVVAAAIKKIESPTGGVQDEEAAILDTVQYLHDEAPDQVFEALKRAVDEANSIQDAQDALVRNTDF